jgi:hypothetical protein
MAIVENLPISFLQRSPKELDRRQRIILEAIDISADTIDLSMRRIKQLALNVVGRSGDPEFSQTERSTLFLDAWAIVDRAHTIGTLLKRGSPSIMVGPDIKFAPEASKATSMRNAMDHVAQQIGNIVKKTRAPPLYGIVTFAWEERKPGTYQS